MENTSLPPGSVGAEPPSDIPGLPAGTFEYVDESKKRNWKKIVEIIAVIVIAAIPLTLFSLFKFNTSVQKVYETINPAYIGSTPSYQTWGGIVTAAKKIIEPVITNQSETNQQQAEQNYSIPSPTTQPNQTTEEQFVYPTQGLEQITSPTQSQNQVDYSPKSKQEVVYPTQPPTPTLKPTATLTPIATPHLSATPTITPPYSQEYEQLPAIAYEICSDLQIGEACWYKLLDSPKVYGKCMPASGGHLACSKN